MASASERKKAVENDNSHGDWPIPITAAPAAIRRLSIVAIAGRGFHADDWPLTLSFGVGAGLISILIMLLYLANDAAPSGFYPHQGWLYAVPAAMLIWLMRVWVLSNRRELHDDPVIFALRDPASLVLGAAVIAAFILSVQ
ncbi:MAG: hypothetical protein JO254_09690 [Pseudolabrys sp.]|nr:hypothetical protein [Pseudolabrys sp.]